MGSATRSEGFRTVSYVTRTIHFQEYMLLFSEGKEAVDMKASERLVKLKTPASTGLSSLVVGRQLSGHRLQIAVKKHLSPSKVQPNISARPRGTKLFSVIPNSAQPKLS